MKFVLCAALLLCSTAALAAPASDRAIDRATQARIDRILKRTPLIDGHNDIAEQLLEDHKYSVANLASGTDKWPANPLMTDMARLRAGRVGGQFWSVYINGNLKGDEAIRKTIEQIDVVDRMIAAYPNDLARALTADDIVRIHKSGKIASLIGIEGGHQIGGSPSALRQYYRLGARYMTLAHFSNSEIADSATDDPEHNGLSTFGQSVVREMNRIGMLVDLAHVSPKAMADALATSKVPVLFTHSDARALTDNPRNVPDEILLRVRSNGGVVMVNFYTGHLSEPYRQWNASRAAEKARQGLLLNGQPDARAIAMKVWDTANPEPTAEPGLVADHIDHIAKVAGHDHVGIGADMDGIDATPVGLEGVDGYPLLFAELIRRGWSDANLAKLAGGNVLRALRAAETYARAHASDAPAPETLPK